MMQHPLMIDLTYTAHGLVKTSTGIVIGGAYIPHVNHGMSADARRMQATIVAHGRACEASHNAIIKENRERWAAHFERPERPCKIALDSSALAQVMRAVRKCRR